MQTAKWLGRLWRFVPLAASVAACSHQPPADFAPDPGLLAHGPRAAELAAAAPALRERRLAEVLAARQDVERNLSGEAQLERGLLALAGPRRSQAATR